MKRDIKTRKSQTVKDMTWYSWDEICDNCGAIIHNHSVETTSPPNTNEEDYCVECLRKKLKL